MVFADGECDVVFVGSFVLVGKVLWKVILMVSFFRNVLDRNVI